MTDFNSTPQLSQLNRQDFSFIHFKLKLKNDDSSIGLIINIGINDNNCVFVCNLILGW